MHEGLPAEAGSLSAPSPYDLTVLSLRPRWRLFVFLRLEQMLFLPPLMAWVIWIDPTVGSCIGMPLAPLTTRNGAVDKIPQASSLAQAKFSA